MLVVGLLKGQTLGVLKIVIYKNLNLIYIFLYQFLLLLVIDNVNENVDCYSNQLVNSTRNKTEIDKLNPSNYLNNVFEMQNMNGQIPRFLSIEKNFSIN